MEKRISQLKDLNNFISSTESALGKIVEKLGWSMNERKKAVMAFCPVNSEHRVPINYLQKHVELCTWKSEGYHTDDIPLPEACDTLHSIKIDGKLANTIIQDAVSKNPYMKTGGYLGTDDRPNAQTSDRIVSDFTTDERRALYDYVISKSEAEPVKLEELNFPFRTEKKDDEQPKSRLEILAAERDAKRRRISYRTKKVSTNRKSHLEVMREVIQNQMELYQEWLNKDAKQEEETIYEGEDPAVRDDSHPEEGNSFEREQDKRDQSSSSSKTRRPIESSRRESRECSHSNKRERYDAGTSRDRSDERIHKRSDHYSSHDKYSEQRDERGKRHHEGYHSRSKDRHKDMREHGGRETRGRRETTSRTEHGAKDYYRPEENKSREKRKRSRRDGGNDEYGDSSRETYRGSSGRKREIVNPYYSDLGQVSVFVEKNGYDPCKEIKMERMDEDNISLWKKEASVEELEVQGTERTTAIKLEDRSNEWSEDSQNTSSSSKKPEKRKKKKEKKSKHKRKKHSKHSKHSKHTASADDSDHFSC